MQQHDLCFKNAFKKFLPGPTASENQNYKDLNSDGEILKSIVQEHEIKDGEVLERHGVGANEEFTEISRSSALEGLKHTNYSIPRKNQMDNIYAGVKNADSDSSLTLKNLDYYRQLGIKTREHQMQPQIKFVTSSKRDNIVQNKNTKSGGENIKSHFSCTLPQSFECKALDGSEENYFSKIKNDLKLNSKGQHKTIQHCKQDKESVPYGLFEKESDLEELKIQSSLFRAHILASTEKAALKKSKAVKINSQNLEFIGSTPLMLRPRILEQINDEPEHSRKLFIGNLDEETAEDDLMYYFVQFGGIERSVIIRDHRTKRSRCLGYIIFKRSYMVMAAQASAPHEIDHKYVTLFVPKEDGCEPEEFCKLFVGNLNRRTSEDDLVYYFEQWGKIVDCIVMRDPETKISKGFGFVTFVLSHMVNDVLAVRHHRIDCRNVKVDMFVEKSKPEPEYLRKLIIKYLNLNTSEGTLINYFEQYGKVVSCVIMRECFSRISRGFGYVIFERACMVAAVQAASPHEIDEREVTLIVPKKLNKEPERLRKLYIENLDCSTSEDTIIYYFEQFGTVESCVLMRDDITRNSQGYGYLIFERAHMVADAQFAEPHVIDDKEVVLSVPKKNRQAFLGSHQIKKYSAASKKAEQATHGANKLNKSYSSAKNSSKEKPLTEKEMLEIIKKSKIFKPRQYHYNLNDFDGAGVNIFKKPSPCEVPPYDPDLDSSSEDSEGNVPSDGKCVQDFVSGNLRAPYKFSTKTRMKMKSNSEVT